MCTILWYQQSTYSIRRKQDRHEILWPKVVLSVNLGKERHQVVRRTTRQNPIYAKLLLAFQIVVDNLLRICVRHTNAHIFVVVCLNVNRFAYQRELAHFTIDTNMNARARGQLCVYSISSSALHDPFIVLFNFGNTRTKLWPKQKTIRIIGDRTFQENKK